MSILVGVQDQAGKSPEQPHPTPGGAALHRRWDQRLAIPPWPNYAVKINSNNVAMNSGQHSRSINHRKAGIWDLASAQHETFC